MEDARETSREALTLGVPDQAVVGAMVLAFLILLAVVVLVGLDILLDRERGTTNGAKAWQLAALAVCLSGPAALLLLAVYR